MIKEFRLKNHMTQKQLAKHLNLTQGYISKLENDNNYYDIKVSTILSISTLFDVNDIDLYIYFSNIIRLHILNKNRSNLK